MPTPSERGCHHNRRPLPLLYLARASALLHVLVGDLVVVEDDLAVVLRLLPVARRVRRLHAGKGRRHPPDRLRWWLIHQFNG